MACDTPREQHFHSNGIAGEDDGLLGEDTFVEDDTVSEEEDLEHTASAEH